MEVCGRVLRTWMPAIHAGMTEEKPVMVLRFHRSVGKRKIINRLVVSI
jgi:hypothetical protein